MSATMTTDCAALIQQIGRIREALTVTWCPRAQLDGLVELRQRYRDVAEEIRWEPELADRFGCAESFYDSARWCSEQLWAEGDPKLFDLE